MHDAEASGRNLAGSLLIAKPTLLDPHFEKTVVLLSVHSQDDGALGVILNRPSGRTLGELDEHFAEGPLAEVQIYEGGPVSRDQMILSAWKCCPDSGVFKLYFGLTEEKAQEIKTEEPDVEIRGFLGYAGWSSGQLEEELEQEAWLVTPVNTEAMASENGMALWCSLAGETEPDGELFPNMPEDPSLN